MFRISIFLQAALKKGKKVHLLKSLTFGALYSQIVPVKNLETYHKEVTKLYLASGKPFPPDQEKDLQQNYYKTKYKVYDLDKKKFQKVSKAYSFLSLSPGEQARIWTHIFKNTQYLGVGQLAIFYFKGFQNKKSHPLIQYWPQLKTWVSSIENWVHGDMLASLYCDILSEAPELVYPELKKWSQQKNPWKNRMAILSLLYYYNPKRVLLPFKDIMALVEPHLNKDHDYLQKAIGWNLREVYRAYPKEYWKFLNRFVLDLSPTAFTTAVERVPRAQKEPLKLKRKKDRQKRGSWPFGTL